MFGWIQHNRCLLSQILFTYQLKFGWVGWPFGAECKWRRVWKQWEKPAQLSMYRQLHRPLSFRCEIQFRERAYAVNIRLHCKWRLVLISAFHCNVDLQLLQPWCKEWRENVGERKIKVKGKKRGKKNWSERAGAEKGERSGIPIIQENKGGWEVMQWEQQNKTVNLWQ